MNIHRRMTFKTAHEMLTKLQLFKKNVIWKFFVVLEGQEKEYYDITAPWRERRTDGHDVESMIKQIFSNKKAATTILPWIATSEGRGHKVWTKICKTFFRNSAENDEIKVKKYMSITVNTGLQHTGI